MPVGGNDTDVVRVVFKVLAKSDLLKMDAVSNVSQTGGGARDLRFSPASAFLPIFRKMLPEVVLARGRETYRGTVFWLAADEQEKSREMTVWPATRRRPNECRIVQVHRFDFSGLVKEDPAGGHSIFMLFQQRNGVVRVHFTTETSLRSEVWNSTIRSFAKYWMGRSDWAFLDLETGERFPP